MEKTHWVRGECEDVGGGEEILRLASIFSPGLGSEDRYRDSEGHGDELE